MLDIFAKYEDDAALLRFIIDMETSPEKNYQLFLAIVDNFAMIEADAAAKAGVSLVKDDVLDTIIADISDLKSK